MSTPHEASLTEKERAILAGLAAQAEAEDPTLAATLRGRRRAAGRPRPTFRLRVPPFVSHWAWGLVLAVVGLIAMVVSLSTVLAVGIVGAVCAAAGVYRAVTARPSRSTPDDAHAATAASSDS
jgi:Protein of unknown function (DUF3040)